MSHRIWGDKRPIIVCDIDGVIATGTKEKVYSNEAGWNYSECLPIAAGIKLLNELREANAVIILHSARWEEDKQITEAWLADHEVPYDELVLGKPYGDIYLDDKSFPKPFLPISGADYTVEALLTCARRHLKEERS